MIFAKNIIRISITAALALAVSACGMFSEPDARYSPAALTDYAPAGTLSVRWSTSIGSGGGHAFAPQLVGDTVFAATPSGAVAALDLASGAVRWRSELGALSAGVGSDGRITAVVAQDGNVIALDARGSELWRTRAATAVSIPPAVGNGIVAVRTTDYRIQAFDAQSGRHLWDVQRPGPALSLRTSIRMVMAPNLLVAGMPNGRLLAIEAANGTVRWENTVASSRGMSDLERMADIVGEPVISGPLLCGVSYQGRITCFDVSQGGHAIWAADVASATGMNTDGQYLYLANERDIVQALDIRDGRSHWQQSALLNRRLSAPMPVGGSKLVVGDFEGYLHLLSATNGDLLARVQLGGGPIVSALLGTSRGLIAQSSDGRIVALNVGG